MSPRILPAFASLAATLAVAAAAPALASAQSSPADAAAASTGAAELQRARTLFEQTLFEEALAVLDALGADAGAGLSRDDVVEWLVLRARLASAQGDDGLADRELVRLARLTDDVPLPPDLRTRFDALAATTPALGVALRWEDGVLEAIAIEDPVLVREVRLSAREPDAADAQRGAGRLAIDAPTECRAELVGPGGAVLASASGCPASARAIAPDARDEHPGGEVDGGGGDDGVWIALGVTAGVLALAAGAITLGVVLGTPPEGVRVGAVMVRW